MFPHLFNLLVMFNRVIGSYATFTMNELVMVGMNDITSQLIIEFQDVVKDAILYLDK